MKFWPSSLISRYTEWLHGQWYGGTVERLPEVGPLGATRFSRVRIAGDLLGIPLLKFASQTGAQVVNEFAEQGFFWTVPPPGMQEMVIIGGGVSGSAAALEAKLLGLKVRLLETGVPLATLANFQVGKPIFTFPTNMVPKSALVIEGNTKETLLASLQKQLSDKGVVFEQKRVSHLTYARDHVVVHIEGEKEPILAKTVVIAVGRSGNFRRLNVPGEDLGKVTNRLHDPNDYKGKKVLVVGGGDSACEAVITMAKAGADIWMAVRGRDLSRSKADLAEEVERLIPGKLLFETRVKEITETEVTLIKSDGLEFPIENDNVFTLIGREPHREFLRKSRLPIAFEWGLTRWLSFLTAFLTVAFIYMWKSEGSWVANAFAQREWFPAPSTIDPNDIIAWFGKWFSYKGSGYGPFRIVGEIFAKNVHSPGFYYELLYTIIILIFGIKRIFKHNTPYITRQTLSLVLIQTIPLFLLPYLILPLMEHWGWFKSGPGLWIADQLFPIPEEGAPREFWRSVGFIFAWPLFIWNAFTAAPLKLWLAIGAFQTFVLIPLLIRRYGKGVYCGWICSCGAMAETLGDAHRAKMPHGPFWNKFNMVGQVILAFAFALLFLRVGSWILIGWQGEASPIGSAFQRWFEYWAIEAKPFGIPLNYSTFVDFFLSGIVGVGLYFHFSGRTWCRFLCPLAALMNIYARFSRFRIFADKKKCISCNGCTSICHQGIDVMNFANKGQPMQDPQCVRCSACVTVCPTGVLSFGYLDSSGNPVLDKILASPTQIRELKLKNGGKKS